MSATAPMTAPDPASATSNARAHGRRLVLSRILWLAMAAFGVSVLAASLAPALHQLQAVCSGPSCTAVQLTPAQAQTLHAVLGLTPGTYALFAFSLSVASACLWVGSGALLWRKLDQGIVLVIALQVITQGVLGGDAYTNGLVDVLTQAHSPWLVPALLLNVADGTLLFFVFALFPTGRFVPRWMRWVAVFWTAFGLLDFLLELITPLVQYSQLPNNAVFVGGVLLLLISAQVYRYRRVSTSIERQQTKWVIFGFIVGNLVQFSVFLPEAVFAPLRQPASLYGPLATQLVILDFALFPVCYMIAILRWHLFAIDTIINKALVYGLLTGLLGALYVGLIIGLESLAGLFIGQAASSPVVPVISTLAIAALFLPVRRRIQNVIDRRLYRKKYDAAKTLEAFAATLRQETDLEQISASLLAVVQETMQPTHVSLWLRPPAWNSTEQAHRLEPREEEPGRPRQDRTGQHIEEQGEVLSWNAKVSGKRC